MPSVRRLPFARFATVLALLLPAAGCVHRRSVADDKVSGTAAPATPTFAERMCLATPMTDTSVYTLVDHDEFSMRLPPRYAPVARTARYDLYASGADTIFVGWGPQDPHALALDTGELLQGECAIDAKDQTADVNLFHSSTDRMGNSELILKARWSDLASDREVLFIAITHYQGGMERAHDALWSVKFKPLPARP